MSDFTPEQDARAIALREANYYFGFTAGIKRPEGLAPGEPTVRAREVLAMAGVFERYILAGELPAVVES